MANSVGYYQKRYRRLKSKGLCVQCGFRKHAEGKVRCVECHASAKSRWKSTRRTDRANPAALPQVAMHNLRIARMLALSAKLDRLRRIA